MKKLVLLAAMFAAFVCIGEGKKTTRGKPSAEERARLMQRYRERRIAKDGGMVVKEDMANRYIAVVNAQKRVPHADVEAFAAAISERYSIMAVVECRDGEVTFESVGAALKKRNVGAALVFADVPCWPILMVAPETRWATVNVAALASDGADATRLRDRFVKEAWRAFAYVGGAADTLRDECLMRPVETLVDIDHLKAKTLSPEPEMRMRQHLAALGVRPVVRATYREACREGWAPAPTNDIQRAIAEQVKADKERGPTNPILIPPPNGRK